MEGVSPTQDVDDWAFDEQLSLSLQMQPRWTSAPASGTPPPGYELAREDSVGPDRVELWIKTRSIAEAQEAS